MNPKVRTAMLVDDDPGIRLIGSKALEVLAGWTVILAQDGHHAVELARHGETPDVILLDMMMPGMDGRTTLAKLRQIDPYDSVPVVMMTARVTDADLTGYQESGVAGVVAKPFDPTSLGRDVQDLVHRYNQRVDLNHKRLSANPRPGEDLDTA